MKAIEQGLDLGVGLLVLGLSVSTAFYGLTSYMQTDLYRGIQDKNTINVEGTLLPSENIPNRSFEDLALTLTAAIQNSDNVRQLKVIIKGKLDPAIPEQAEEQSLQSSFEDTRRMLIDCIARYKVLDNYYGTRIDNGHFQAFVTTDQSNITCYILVE